MPPIQNRKRQLYTAFILVFPAQFVCSVIFIVYVVFHFATFVAESACIVSWLIWVGQAATLLALTHILIFVFRRALFGLAEIGHSYLDIQRKAIENRAIAARHDLLHAGENYVVYAVNGEIAVQSVVQEKYNYSIRQSVEGAENTDGATQGSAGVQVPLPFASLLSSGVIQRAIEQEKMVLGYADGELRYGSWLDLYSCGVGGVSGSGKTTTVRFLLFQLLLSGARFVMVDPHIEDEEESLAAQFKAFNGIHAQTPCDENPAQIEKRIRWIMKECLRRKERGVKGPPLVFILDEFNAIVRRLPDELRKELADLLLTIAQEGRKFGIFAMIIAQRWSEQDLGGKNYGAAIRSSLASTIAHRFTDEDQAKKLVGNKNGSKCLNLPQGHYLFRDTQGHLQEMITPYTANEDAKAIALILAASTASRRSLAAFTEPLTASSVGIPSIPDLPVLHRNNDCSTLDARTEQVVELLKNRVGQSEIIEKVWGRRSSDGRPYRAALDEYREVIAQYIQRK